MSLKILHAIQTANSSAGGPIEGVRQLTAVNARYGHVIELATLDSPDAPWVRDFEIPIHALGPGLGGYGFSTRFKDWMGENVSRYDAVIINGIWGFNALGTWMAIRNRSIPYMVFTHGMLDPWFKHRYPLKHAKKWLYWPWGLYPVLRDADAVFFTCEAERLLARESFWLYDCNEAVVHYGTAGIPNPTLDYGKDFLAAHPTLQGKRNFLFFGRVHPKKGPDLLIRAVGNLKGQGLWDEATMRLVMAGPAESDYAETLKRLVRREKLEKSVYWTGMLVGEQKWGAFQASEAFVLPSHQENFGIAVAEALSAGVPVLISHAVNISPEIAVDGAGLVDEDTFEGTVRLLRKWLRIPDADRQEMRNRTRKTFLSRYTAEVGAKDLLRNIYLVLGTRSVSAAPPAKIAASS